MRSLPAYGFEINPSAWIFSKIYEFINIPYETRKTILRDLRNELENEFPILIFSDPSISRHVIEEKVIRIGSSISNKAKILCNALVVLLDIHNHQLTNDLVLSKFGTLAKLVQSLPYSIEQIKADLQDARALPLEKESIDFVITSPPYINVFNYHQNYRRSVEVLGWDLLRVAKSEIGSNRANRSNRFHTVTQYCIDMAQVLQELARVLRQSARVILIVGHESNVLGTPFYNAAIIEQIAAKSGFSIVLRQTRRFTNRFGKQIREEVINLSREAYIEDETLPVSIGKAISKESLVSALERVPDKNRELLHNSIEQVPDISGTPLFSSANYKEYHTRDRVMMVKENPGDSIHE